MEANERNAYFLEALAHVEACTYCQSRMGSSVRSELPWWEEAKSSWRALDEEFGLEECRNPSVIIEVQSEMPSDARIEYETVALSFLESAPHPELLGRLGRYDIERVIGVGGMGIVLKAYDTELHRVVAIKVLATHLANNASARKRFAREAQAAAAVLHANVVPIYDVESEGRIPYLVMQCVHGQSLQARVDAHGPIPLSETLRIALQTASGLSAAHDQGLVHRDVKPANILLHDHVDRVSLSDFGLARAVDDASLTRTGVVTGTPHYMSPEQAHGDAIDTRSDQFSLGSVLYFMLCGHTPFRASTAMGVLHRICSDPHRPIRQINPDVPKQVADLIDKLMAKNPCHRFASMSDVVKQLEQLLSTLQSGAWEELHRREPTRSLRLPWKENRFTWAALALVLVSMSAAATSLIRDRFIRTTQRVSIDEQLQLQAATCAALDREWESSYAAAKGDLVDLENDEAPFGTQEIDHFVDDVASIQRAIDELGKGLPKLVDENDYEAKLVD
jgi:hypothetical protein